MTRRSYLAGDDVVIARLPEDLRPRQVVEHALEVAANGGGGGRDPDPSDPLPPGPTDNHGFGFVAPVTETTASRLEQIVELLERRIRQPDPLLVAIAEDDTAARTVADSFASTLLVQPNMRNRIDDLLPFLPGFVENTHRLGTIGSVRLPRPIDVDDAGRWDQALTRALTRRKGVPLHRVAREPYWQHYSFAAPARFHDPVRETLEADHLASHATAEPVIQLAGLVFEDEQDPTAVELGEPEPADGRDERVVGSMPDKRQDGGEFRPKAEDD